MEVVVQQLRLHLAFDSHFTAVEKVMLREKGEVQRSCMGGPLFDSFDADFDRYHCKSLQNYLNKFGASRSCPYSGNARRSTSESLSVLF